MARKITGMLLECDAQEKAEMLADEARMNEWVSLATEELQRAGLLDTASIHGTTQGILIQPYSRTGVGGNRGDSGGRSAWAAGLGREGARRTW